MSQEAKTDSGKDALTREERELLALARDSLAAMGGRQEEGRSLPEYSEDRWEELLGQAHRHAILPFAYDLLEDGLPEYLQEKAAAIARRTVQQSYHLLWQTHMVVEALARERIGVAVLKGIATAGCYPTPELRKSGDIDLLLTAPERLSDAREVLLSMGFSVDDVQLSEHHIAFSNSEGIELELHTMLAEPFDNRPMNNYMEKCLREIPGHMVEREIMGYTFPILSDGYHAYELLLHMLQHFLRAGFGLKLLCDWVVFWNRPVQERETMLYGRLVRESRLEGFSDMITSACVYELGLSAECPLLSSENAPVRLAERDAVEHFYKEILEAEEFGRTARDRMVIMRSSGIAGYVREFHHQMHLNFPRAGRCFLLWPGLWTVTLVRFLRNNRKVRGVSVREVLRKADDRSRVMEKIRLFEERE